MHGCWKSWQQKSRTCHRVGNVGKASGYSRRRTLLPKNIMSGTEDRRNHYCCGQLFQVYHGMYLITFHCLLQATYGITVVITSSYDPINSVVNYTVVASNVCLVPMAIFLLWANLYQNHKGLMTAAIFLLFIAIFALASSITYFSVYVNFRANSVLDMILLKGNNTWVGEKDVPFTVWHIIALSLILVEPMWLYYASVTWRYGFQKKQTNDIQQPNR